jgi:hypothetical protein
VVALRRTSRLAMAFSTDTTPLWSRLRLSRLAMAFLTRVDRLTGTNIATTKPTSDRRNVKFNRTLGSGGGPRCWKNEPIWRTAVFFGADCFPPARSGDPVNQYWFSRQYRRPRNWVKRSQSLLAQSL